MSTELLKTLEDVDKIFNDIKIKSLKKRSKHKVKILLDSENDKRVKK